MVEGRNMLSIFGINRRQNGVLVIYLALAAALGGCTTTSGVSGMASMRIGAPTFAPLGYLAFCARRPDQCPSPQTSAPPVTVQVAAAAPPSLAPAPTMPVHPSYRLDRSVELTAPDAAPEAGGRPLLTLASWSPPRRALPDDLGGSEAGAGLSPLAFTNDSSSSLGVWVIDPMPDLFAGVISDGPAPASPPPDAAPAAPPAAPPEIAATGPVHATPQLLAMLNQTNQRINAAIRPAPDPRGVDYWDLPLDPGGAGSGDCKDYVLQKREELVSEGVSAGSLSIAVVRTRRGETHAVLIVTTDGGEYVLDNLTPWVTPWRDLRYTWLKRQLPGGGPSDWVSLDADR
jgi:predicted transglutaminase-like cysteine proteinase